MIEPNSRILVINVARIGDTLLVTPVLRALKESAPGVELTCMAHPNRIDVLKHLPFVDHLKPITKNTAIWQGWLPGHHWDHAFVYGHDEALVSYALRVSRKVVAFRQRDERLNRKLSVVVPVPAEPMHAVENRGLLALAEDVAITNPRLGYQVTDEEMNVAKKEIAQLAPEASPLVVMHVSSFPTKAYRDWPTASFEELGKRILARYPNAAIVLTGGPDDKDKVAPLQQALGKRAINLAGRLHLRSTAAILSMANLYIGVDTGITHLAGALDLPMVALYHCFHRGTLLAPLNHSALRVIEHPCKDGDCTRQTEMGEIPVGNVWQAATELLDSHGFSPA